MFKGGDNMGFGKRKLIADIFKAAAPIVIDFIADIISGDI